VSISKVCLNLSPLPQILSTRRPLSLGPEVIAQLTRLPSRLATPSAGGFRNSPRTSPRGEHHPALLRGPASLLLHTCGGTATLHHGSRASRGSCRAPEPVGVWGEPSRTPRCWTRRSKCTSHRSRCSRCSSTVSFRPILLSFSLLGSRGFLFAFKRGVCCKELQPGRRFGPIAVREVRGGSLRQANSVFLQFPEQEEGSCLRRGSTSAGSMGSSVDEERGE